MQETILGLQKLIETARKAERERCIAIVKSFQDLAFTQNYVSRADEVFNKIVAEIRGGAK